MIYGACLYSWGAIFACIWQHNVGGSFISCCTANDIPLFCQLNLGNYVLHWAYCNSQEKKSTSHLCIEVGKSGKVESCKYGTSCRFSHDIDAYLAQVFLILFIQAVIELCSLFNFKIAFCAQKPADLEGTCPFSTLGQSCPYGLACRFLGTHKDNLAPLKTEGNHERNPLSKDIQKLLWKNKYKFPKASAQIKLLGLKVDSYFCKFLIS